MFVDFIEIYILEEGPDLGLKSQLKETQISIDIMEVEALTTNADGSTLLFMKSGNSYTVKEDSSTIKRLINNKKLITNGYREQ